MGADRNRIDELARAVAQRTKVAWDDEMRSAEDGTDQAIIAQLETVERIIEAHWGLPGNVKNLGDFEIIEEIGRGGMGVVYKARQTSLDRYVAVKVLSWDFVSSEVSIARFEREAKALAALEHPNIVGVHSVDRVDDLHFISMELVEGDALSSVIPEHGMKLEDMLDIAVPLADALSFAHEHGVVHRDFKPANVMIDQTRRPKVLDFGLARLRRENRLSSDARKVTATFDTTEKSSLLGTVPYMSPEQAEGQELDHRTDIFSLGVVLYEMATGRRPFDGSSPASVISSIVNDCHPPVRTIRSELPRDLERIIFHCLRKNPEQRYQTAKGLRNELEELAKRIELEQFKPKPPRRSAWWKAIAVAVAFLTLVVFLDEIIEKISEMFPPPVETERAKYLAVLPFDVLGQADEDMETISLGLNEVLTTKLNQLTATQYLQVATPSPTSFSPSATTRDVGVSLGANLLVTGTILRLDMDNVRFTVNLFDLDEEIQSQTRTVDTDLKNPFTLQDRIVTAVVAMIELELDARERGNLLSHGTKSAAPEWAYLQALGLLTSHLCSGAQGWCNDRIENTDKAISLLQQAIDEDSDHAEALALLGTTYWKRFEHDGDVQWADRAREVCEKAVQIDEDLSEGHLCLADVHRGHGDFGEAKAHYGWAMSLEPTLEAAYR
ncbi:MAG: protein kinase, partial [Acidobacteria bacterium]|nr:protein kinase [Acidobacteriota bacterium]NIM62178.1 protein kinase [Acidobacteriota bacterium]NIO58972.1 protein kinase [Acidobacteriota bacterium]NIQ30018.1 protein kinase [Acidobacteriota bacterium]NIQ84784.1 protein kinase [Acidobacteriota bacterium]